MPSPRPARSRRRRTESGAAALEFALVLPILLLLVFGILQYGLYFWAMQGGADIARDAARRAAVSDPASCTAFLDSTRHQVQDLVGHATPTLVHRTYARRDADRVQVNDTVRVRVEFDSPDLHLPFVPFIADGRVAQSAEARVESVPTTSPLADCS